MNEPAPRAKLQSSRRFVGCMALCAIASVLFVWGFSTRGHWKVTRFAHVTVDGRARGNSVAVGVFYGSGDSFMEVDDPTSAMLVFDCENWASYDGSVALTPVVVVAARPPWRVHLTSTHPLVIAGRWGRESRAWRYDASFQPTGAHFQPPRDPLGFAMGGTRSTSRDEPGARYFVGWTGPIWSVVAYDIDGAQRAECTVPEAASSRFARSMCSIRNSSGDAASIIVGAPWTSYGDERGSQGAVHAFDLDLHPRWTYEGTVASNYLGRRVTPIPDIDGDGVEDVIAAVLKGGSAHILSGRTGELLKRYPAADPLPFVVDGRQFYVDHPAYGGPDELVARDDAGEIVWERSTKSSARHVATVTTTTQPSRTLLLSLDWPTAREDAREPFAIDVYDALTGELVNRVPCDPWPQLHAARERALREP